VERNPADLKPIYVTQLNKVAKFWFAGFFQVPVI